MRNQQPVICRFDCCNGSLAAPDACDEPTSASQHIAELPWTQISGEFSSQFGQKGKAQILLGSIPATAPRADRINAGAARPLLKWLEILTIVFL